MRFQPKGDRRKTCVEECASIDVRGIAPALRGWPLQLLCEVNGRPITVNVHMIAARSVFGKGRQWWFLCPYCRRRCGWLYLPPGVGEFACRRCWHLGYRAQLRNYLPSQKRLRQALAVLEHWQQTFPEASPLRPHPLTREVRLAGRTDDPARRA